MYSFFLFLFVHLFLGLNFFFSFPRAQHWMGRCQYLVHCVGFLRHHFTEHSIRVDGHPDTTWFSYKGRPLLWYLSYHASGQESFGCNMTDLFGKGTCPLACCTISICTLTVVMIWTLCQRSPFIFQIILHSHQPPKRHKVMINFLVLYRAYKSMVRDAYL